MVHLVRKPPQPLPPPSLQSLRPNPVRIFLLKPIPRLPLAPALAISLLGSLPLPAQDPALSNSQTSEAGIPRKVERRNGLAKKTSRQTNSKSSPLLPADIAPIDGWGNNIANPHQGAAGQPFIRLTNSAYRDGQSEPAGASRPNPRTLSNAICCSIRQPA